MAMQYYKLLWNTIENYMYLSGWSTVILYTAEKEIVSFLKY